ncbi:MAG: AraC family transcriptional regulator [Firmicutes bacterium]|nr:AraC family transcriptional regulator [Bacillota bacterium]
MSHIFTYRDNKIYSHHSIDKEPYSDDFAMHAHEWMEILYIISGAGTYLVEGNQYPISAGDIFILRPAEMHKLQIDADIPYERMVIHFSPSILDEVDPDHTLLRAFIDRPLGTGNRFVGGEKNTLMLSSAFSGFEFDNIPNTRINLTGRLMLFLSILDGIYGKGQTHLPAEGFQVQLLEYVNEHLFEDISIQSVADVFYRSRSQISRVFRQATGTSLWDYVTVKRLMAARAMIRRGESAISACTACGFSEYSSFYRAYKSHFGHSPKEDAGKE